MGTCNKQMNPLGNSMICKIHVCIVSFISVEYREHLHLNLHTWSSGPVGHMGTVGICSHLLLADKEPFTNLRGGGGRLCSPRRLVPKNVPPGLNFSARWLKEASLKLLAGSKWSVALHDTWNKMQTPTLHCVHSTQCTTGLYYILMYQAERIQRRSQQLSPIGEHNGFEPPYIYSR